MSDERKCFECDGELSIYCPACNVAELAALKSALAAAEKERDATMKLANIAKGALDSAENELAAAEAEKAVLRSLLEHLIGAVDAGSLEMNSPELTSVTGEPYPWHEEWLAGVRHALA